MDEPFAALDALTKVAMHRLIKNLLESESSPSAVLITHDISEALILSDSVIAMSNRPGRILKEVASSFRRSSAEVTDIEVTDEFLQLRHMLLKILIPSEG